MLEEIRQFLRRDTDGQIGAAVAVVCVAAAVMGVLELDIAPQFSDADIQLSHELVQIFRFNADFHGGDELLALQLGYAAGGRSHFLIDTGVPVHGGSAVRGTDGHGILGHGAAACQQADQHQQGNDASCFHIHFLLSKVGHLYHSKG